MGQKIDPAKFEAFCHGLADGLSIRKAGIRAGYSGNSRNVNRIAKREDSRRRVAALKRYRELTVDGPIVLVLALKDAAGTALSEPADRDYNAVARLLTEAGRLQLRLPAVSVEGGMTDDEWTDRYGPKS